MPEPAEGVGASSAITACLPACHLSFWRSLGVSLRLAALMSLWFSLESTGIAGVSPHLGSVYSSQSTRSSFCSYCTSPVCPRSLQQWITNSTWKSYVCAYSVRSCMWFSRKIARESTDVLWYIKIISNIQVCIAALSDTVWYNHPQIPVMDLLNSRWSNFHTAWICLLCEIK